MAIDADRGCVMNVVTGEMHAPKAHSRLPNTAASIPGSAPLFFVIGVSDGAILKNNFMISPCLAPADALFSSHLLSHFLLCVLCGKKPYFEDTP
jgi:hypothetical protein